MRATRVYAASMPAAKPATTLVLLVRHGVTPTTGRLLPGRRRGLHLSDEGRRQAEALTTRLAAVPKIAAIYSSPLERARETVAPLAKARGLAVCLERGLLEVDPGTWTGLSLKRAARRPEWAIVQRHASAFRFPGGESFVEMQARMASTLTRLVERHPGEIIVVASHADPIKTLVAWALGTPLDLFQRIVIAPASITAIACRSEGLTVLTMNAMNGDLASLVNR
jgi:probable phosphomutase (TIGR03848 family)